MPTFFRGYLLVALVFSLLMAGPARSEETVQIVLESTSYALTLEQTAAAQAFAGLLPLTLTMQELNGNEKYARLPRPLPHKDEAVGYVRAGDLMLFGKDCLVLFYKSFATNYPYTRLGRLNNPTDLARIVGSQSIDVTIHP